MQAANSSARLSFSCLQAASSPASLSFSCLQASSELSSKPLVLLLVSSYLFIETLLFLFDNGEHFFLQKGRLGASLFWFFSFLITDCTFLTKRWVLPIQTTKRLSAFNQTRVFRSILLHLLRDCLEPVPLYPGREDRKRCEYDDVKVQVGQQKTCRMSRRYDLLLPKFLFDHQSKSTER